VVGRTGVTRPTGALVLDFSSALYLGLRHASHELAPWSQLTLGAPAALIEPTEARLAATKLARLAGCESATICRSSLHALLDLIPIFADARTTSLLVDSGVYAVSQWAVELAVARGASADRIRHYDPEDAWVTAHRYADAGRRPVIVLDGSCPGCGRTAPIAHYLEVAKQFGGRVVMDDTQAFGLAGPEGGGSLRETVATDAAPALVVASLAKAFGAPVAFVGGSAQDIARFVRRSETRVHLSPPSMADLHAALHALHVNAVEGDARRAYLRDRIQQLQRGLADLSAPSGMTPVQPVPTGRLTPGRMYQRLLAAGVRGVLHRSCDGRPRVSLILTAMLTPSDIDRAVQTIWRCIGA
jgi:8-amino-7-oxononanoate synthase